MKTAVELLREFATYQGNGIRMKNMQLEAQTILKRIDQTRARAARKKAA